MLSRTIKQNPVGYRIRGCNLYQNYHTGSSDWSKCTGCLLSIGRTRTAVRNDGERHWNGERLIRLLFIGTAPGTTENTTGIPFTGLAGRILFEIFNYTPTAFSYCLTNLTCCQTKSIIIPDFGRCDSAESMQSLIDSATIKLSQTKSGSVKSSGPAEYYDYNRQPNSKEISACSSHLTELSRSFKPEGIIYLSPIARNSFHTSNTPTLDLCDLPKITQLEYKLLPVRRAAVSLTNFLQEIRGRT